MNKNIVLLFVLVMLVEPTGGGPLAVPPGHDVSRAAQTVFADEIVDQTPTLQISSRVVGDSVYGLCDLVTFSFGGSGGSDCWGYNPQGGDSYAIMGVYNGVAFVNTSTMSLVQIVPGPGPCGYSWRDIKTWGQYCYVVSECIGANDGIMVIDMQFLPDSVHLVRTIPVFPYDIDSTTSHNLSVDTIAGYLYAEGTYYAGTSIHIYSLADPTYPSYVNSFGPNGGIHDLYVNNDTAYIAEGVNSSFSIWDMADKNSPSMLVRIPMAVPGYLHNIWPTEDGNYVITTEESAFHTMKIWDIQDFGNVQMVAEFLGPSGLAHNCHVRGDRLFVSHYESGVSVYDITDPTAPFELDVFDTYPTSDSAMFNGCWGVYPWAPDGMVYGSNLDGRLFVLTEYMYLPGDTLAGDDVSGQRGEQIRVDISATNSEQLETILIPIDWNGTFDLDLDSASTVGLRTDYFQTKTFVSWNPGGKKAAYLLNAGSQPTLPPGSGPIVSLYFTIPYEAYGDSNLVAFTAYNQYVANFSSGCVNLTPELVSAVVRLTPPPCCTGIRGNADGDIFQSLDVADLTFLVDYLFRGGPSPWCNEEGNADGSLDEQINVADVTYMVDYLYRDGPPPPACP